MKLSMWMIANRLHDMDLELHIRDDAPRTLKSARRAYADNCVWVYQEGRNVVCKADEDYILIRDMSVSAAAEILQGVFDYYDDWDYSIREDAAELNFQKIIDRSWHIFRNPMVLLDANWNVLALSSRYGEDDLDAEWKHLKRYGASSMDVYLYMRSDQLNNYNREGVQYFHMSNPALTNCLSSLIIYKGMICGRVNVLETDRKLNRGDVQNLEYLIHVLSLYIGRADMKDNGESNTLSVMHNLLEGRIEDEDLIRKRMEYMGWKDGEDTFYVLVISPKDTDRDRDTLAPLRNQLLRQLIYSDVSLIEDNLVIVLNKESDEIGQIRNLLHEDSSHLFYAARSLDFYDIRMARYFYKQARFALWTYWRKQKNEMDTINDNPIIRFYDYAIEYIILKNKASQLLMACHPSVVRLLREDLRNGTEHMKTFNIYLDNERSLVNAARQLYVHRNTLVYRINKILELIGDDMEDVYTRDYMKLSIRILNMFEDASIFHKVRTDL
ncbi:MAG: PucR family transcriptional regulator [Lachnospiraceae bacterium]